MGKYINKRDRIRKNRTTLAIYYALFFHNEDRKKALITITKGDGSLNELLGLKRDFIYKLNSYSRAKDSNKKPIAYFAQIELFGKLKKLNPHLHFQLFYDDDTPIKKVMAYLEKNEKLANLHILKARSNKAFFKYVVKEYGGEYDKEFEEQKKTYGMGKPLYTSTRKDITNYVIKYIFGYYRQNIPLQWNVFEDNQRYYYLLEQVEKGNILTHKRDDTLPKQYIIVQNTSIWIKIDSIYTI